MLIGMDGVSAQILNDFHMGDSFAMTLGHAIYIKPEFAAETSLIQPELVHVSQVERVGIALIRLLSFKS